MPDHIIRQYVSPDFKELELSLGLRLSRNLKSSKPKCTETYASTLRLIAFSISSVISTRVFQDPNDLRLLGARIAFDHIKIGFLYTIEVVFGEGLISEFSGL